MAASGDAITATILCDNYEFDPNLQTSWGFSCLIQGLERTILFDANGPGGTLLHNMQVMHLDPQTVEAVVLSHPHADHTGGLQDFLDVNWDIAVYGLGTFSAAFVDMVTSTDAQYIPADEPMDMCDGAFTTGQVPGSIPEQAIAVETAAGCVVITGCAHPGVDNMVRAARDARSCDVNAVFGGFHTRSLPEQTVRNLAGELKALGVTRAGPTHCSGDRARQVFRQEFGDDFVDAGVGCKLEFER